MLAARLLVEKGIREFVQSPDPAPAWAISKDARFVIVGKPDPANPASLRPDELAQWDKEDVVELWGHRTDMPRVLEAAHAQFCYPTMAKASKSIDGGICMRSSRSYRSSWLS